MEQLYLIGSEGNAGTIIREQLKSSGKETICIDIHLKNLDKFKPTKNDFVIIATPPKMHLEYIKKCEQVGCKVFVEKPMTYDFKEALEINEEYGKENIYVNYNTVLMDELKILEQYKNNEVLEIKRFLKYGAPKYIQSGHRGVVLDIFPHLLSIYKMFGKIPNVETVALFVKDGIDKKAEVSLKNGVILVAEYESKNNYGLDDITIINTKERIIFLPRISEETWKRSLELFFAGKRNFADSLEIMERIDEVYENNL